MGNLGHCDLNMSLGIVRVVNSGMLRRSGHFVGWEGKKFVWNCGKETAWKVNLVLSWDFMPLEPKVSLLECECL
jgi:hypothetical protein